MYNFHLEDHYSGLTDIFPWLTSCTDNGNSMSRDSSEHGSRRSFPRQQDSTPSTPTGCGLGLEFASAIQSLAELAAEKQQLQLKRERARQDCDEAKLIYETGKATHSQFPIEAERAKERCAKEKSALEVLEAKVKDANSKISTTTATLAQHYNSLISSKGGAVSIRSGTEVGSLEAENRQLKENLTDMKTEIRRLHNEFELRLKGAEDRMKSDTRDQVVAMNSSLVNKADNFVTLSRDVLELKKNSDYHKNQLVQQQDQLREYKNALKKLGGLPYKGGSNVPPSPGLGGDGTLVRIQSVETQLAAEHSSNLNLASQIETIKQTQAKNMSTIQEIQLAIANTSSLELVPRIDAIERGQANMLRIQDNFEQLERNLSGFDDDLGGHDQRIKALESSSNGPRLTDTTGLENSLTSVAPHGTNTTSSLTQRIDAFENSINEIIAEMKESQDASDMAYGAVIQAFKESVSQMEAKVADLIKDVESLESSQSVASIEQLQKSVRDLRSAFASSKSGEAVKLSPGDGTRVDLMALQAQQRAMSEEQRQMLRRVGSLESDFVHMKPVKAIVSTNGLENVASAPPTQNGVSRPSFGLGPALDELRNQISEIQTRLVETKQFEAGINMGIRNLDTRMNNIYTEHLCKQILGQLQTVYPNLGRVESLLADLKARMGLVESTYHNHTESIGYIKDSQDAIQGWQQAWENKYPKEIADLSTAMDGVRDAISALQSLDGASRKLAESDGQDLASLKKEMAERIDSLSEETEASSKHLQKQIEGIEHLIEFDDDGKVESVKEVIHVLTENYGKMMGEFDALDSQVQALKKEVASNRTPSSSRPDSPALASSTLFREFQSGNKRSAPSSPSASTGFQAPGQHQKKKRMKKFPLILGDEDQESAS